MSQHSNEELNICSLKKKHMFHILFFKFIYDILIKLVSKNNTFSTKLKIKIYKIIRKSSTENI